MKHFIPVMVILLMVSTSFVGISYSEEKSSRLPNNCNTPETGRSYQENYSKIKTALNNSKELLFNGAKDVYLLSAVKA